MTEKRFFESTTTIFPDYIGDRRPTETKVTWSVAESPKEAYSDLIARAKAREFDGIIDVTFESIPMTGGGHRLETVVFYLAYGTAVKFAE